VKAAHQPLHLDLATDHDPGAAHRDPSPHQAESALV
jgi:hypothetical protein